MSETKNPINFTKYFKFLFSENISKNEKFYIWKQKLNEINENKILINLMMPYEKDLQIKKKKYKKFILKLHLTLCFQILTCFETIWKTLINKKLLR